MISSKYYDGNCILDKIIKIIKKEKIQSNLIQSKKGGGRKEEEGWDRDRWICLSARYQI
jgi:hypothetical protein